jgi:hypothetical protein
MKIKERQLKKARTSETNGQIILNYVVRTNMEDYISTFLQGKIRITRNLGSIHIHLVYQCLLNFVHFIQLPNSINPLIPHRFIFLLIKTTLWYSQHTLLRQFLLNATNPIPYPHSPKCNTMNGVQIKTNIAHYLTHPQPSTTHYTKRDVYKYVNQIPNIPEQVN